MFWNIIPGSAFAGKSMLILSVFLLAAVSAAHLIDCLADNSMIANATKPFLMPTVILLHISLCGFIHPFVIVALIFGCIGDVFLMLVIKKRAFFTAGMASFLIGHAAYVLAAHKACLFVDIFPQFTVPVIITVCVMFVGAVCIYAFLYRHIYKGLKLACGLYILALTTMACTMICAFINRFDTPTLLMAIGGALFLISDFTLACRVFGVIKRKRMNFCVMLTYIAAQTCLAVGFALCAATVIY